MQPTFSPCSYQVIDRFFSHFSAGSHDHDHSFGIRGADIIKQVVLAPNQLGEFIHRLLDDFWCGVVIGVNRFTALEIYIRVLSRTAQLGTIWGEGAFAVRLDQFIIDHRPQIIIAQLFDLVHFMRCAETVKEMQEGYARFKCSCRWRSSALSWASCTNVDASMANPVWRAAITSE